MFSQCISWPQCGRRDYCAWRRDYQCRKALLETWTLLEGGYIAADSHHQVRNLSFHLSFVVRPRISNINYVGLEKSEREDMEQKLVW